MKLKLDKTVINMNNYSDSQIEEDVISEDIYQVSNFGAYDYNTISYYLDDELYFYPTGFKQILRYPGQNSYGLCDLSEKLFNTVGFYYSEIIKITSGLDLIHIVSPLAGKKDGVKSKEEYHDFIDDVDVNSVADDMLIDTYKYGVYFGYLDYKTIDGEQKDHRIVSLNPKYIKILGNDGKTITIGVDLFSVVGKNKESLFPPSLRKRIKRARSRLIKDNKLTVTGGVLNDDGLLYFKNQYVKIDINRTVVVLNGDTKRATWGQVPFLKAIDSIITYERLEPRKRKAIDTGSKKVISEILPGTDKKSAAARVKTVKLGNTASNQQHEHLKNIAQDKINNVGALSLAPGTEIEVLSIDDVFNTYNSRDDLLRQAFNSGIAFDTLTGAAEGKAIENYTKNALNIAYKNLIKFQREIDKVFHGSHGKTEKVVTLTYIKLNDYIKKDVFNAVSKLFTEAGGSYEYYIAGAGFEPRAYIGNMQEERDKEYDDKYLPHLTANNISKDDDNVSGRSDGGKDDESNGGNKDGEDE